MPNRTFKSKARKIGAAPGTLVHIGEQKTPGIRINVIRYGPDWLEETAYDSLQACLADKATLVPADSTSVTWLNVDGLHQVEVLEQLGDLFGLHPLLQEDVLNTDQRPKVEDYGEYLYIVLKMIDWQENRNFQPLDIEQISLILGRNYVLSFQEKPGDLFEPVRARLRGGKSKFRQNGTDFLAYSLMDAVVDHYYLILEKMSEKLEIFEREIVQHPTPMVLKHLHAVRRQLILLRRSIWPVRDMVSTLLRSESALLTGALQYFLRDLYDHAVQIMDTVDTMRDMTGGLMDIYLSLVSQRMNEVMKVLTIIATIFIPLTFIVGVYGMNFHYMPELNWRYGYPAIWGVMIAIALSMLVWFRKNRWI